MLTEMDDWADFSDENSGEGSEDEGMFFIKQRGERSSVFAFRIDSKSFC